MDLVCAICMYTREGVAAPAVTVIAGTAVCDAHNVYVSSALSQVISTVRREQAVAQETGT